MKKIVFVSDFFENEILGGAEICNEVLIKNLLEQKYDLKKIKSNELKENFILKNKESFFIISNFFFLSENIKNFIITNNITYVIYEHDHKYVTTNNPTNFPCYVIDEEYLINLDFYKNAKAVLAQSKIHSEIIQKNLLLNNLINLGGNLWNDKQINIIKKNMFNKKKNKYGILETNNKNKGMRETIKYCKQNKLEYTLIPFTDYENFIKNLSEVENLIFFPQWLETFSRVCVEAKILGCKLITNKLIGAKSESFLEKSPQQIIDIIINKNKEITETFIKLIEDEEICFMEKILIPKISIITSLYNGIEFIEHFLQDITRQTIFHNCELIILDANSEQNEYKIIKKYMNKYQNIKYIRFDERLNVHETLNKGIQMSTGDYITIANVDDRRIPECLEILSKHLYLNKEIDLVYGDTILTFEKNKFVEEINVNEIYEHSRLKFSKENMVKCLPGPIPMWRKKMSIDNGNFDEKLKYAGDWEFWLRCVQNNSKFKKIEKIIGSYFYNPKGLSTNKQTEKERYLEERDIFIKYKNLFGTKNYNIYKGYFNAE